MAELSEILKAAIQLKASDIHFVTGTPPIIRINGRILELSGSKPLSADECKSLIYSALSESQRARFEEKWELDYSFSLRDLARFRGNVFLQNNGVAAVYRIVPSVIPSPQEISLTPAILKTVEAPRGLVIVTGPTGSGKSTTLACLIQMINEKQRTNIITIEDPIEFMHENKLSIILQREVGRHTQSFNNALRSAMRQDPDIIMVGEMRDLETIRLAITAAETGHLCFATLHTQDCASTVDRIIDVFPPHQQQQIRVQLSMSLNAIISQILLPRKDGKGRVAAREFMTMTSAVSSLIREGKSHMLYGAIETGGKFGMISMDQYLAFLVKQGYVEESVALSKAHDQDNVKNILQLGT